MADRMFTFAMAELMRGNHNYVSDDIRFMIAGNSSTLGTATDEDITTFAGASVLDEYVGSNYSSPGIAFTSQTVVTDNTNNRGEFNGDTSNTFTSLGADAGGTILGVVVYKFVTNLNASIPIAFIDSGGILGFNGNGGNFTITWNTEGIIQLANAA